MTDRDAPDAEETFSDFSTPDDADLRPSGETSGDARDRAVPGTTHPQED